MPDRDDLLDHPDFEAIRSEEEREAEEALHDPEKRDRLMLRTLLRLRTEARMARRHCVKSCKPETVAELKSHGERIGRLERYVVRVGGGVVVVGAIWTLFGDKIVARLFP